MSTIKVRIQSILKSDNQRSQVVLKNIFFSFGIKGGGILVGLVLVPITIDYINPVQYGLWLTISSLLTWMSFFDIGLGNGLRNNLASTLSKDNIEEARKFVSTTYAIICLIAFVLFIMFLTINPYLNWRGWLNVPGSVPDDIDFIMLIVLISFCFLFVAQLINTVLTAIHKPAIASLLTFLGQLGILVAVLILKKTVPGTLTLLITALTIIPILVFIIASIYLYGSTLRYLSPSFGKIDFKYVKSLMSTGGVFFIIQIGTVLLYQTNNIIITNIMGPEAVTEFNVSYKLFSVIIIIFTIIITPYWSAFTDAYVKKDFAWMKKTIKNMRKMWLVLALCSLCILFASKQLLIMWLGGKVAYNWNLSVAMTLYVIVFMWQNLHVYFLNGVGKIRLQLILYIIGSAVNVPLVIWMGKTWGLTGVITANSILFAVIGLIFSVQVKYILENRAKGIWSK